MESLTGENKREGETKNEETQTQKQFTKPSKEDWA